MGKYAVEYHAPNIAQHYTAYQVRHEEHGAEQIGALYALCQHISYRKSKHVDYYEETNANMAVYQKACMNDGSAIAFA